MGDTGRRGRGPETCRSGCARSWPPQKRKQAEEGGMSCLCHTVRAGPAVFWCPGKVRAPSLSLSLSFSCTRTCTHARHWGLSLGEGRGQPRARAGAVVRQAEPAQQTWAAGWPSEPLSDLCLSPCVPRHQLSSPPHSALPFLPPSLSPGLWSPGGKGLSLSGRSPAPNAVPGADTDGSEGY